MAGGGKNISVVHPLRRTSRVCFGDVVYKPAGECGPRVQQDLQFVIVHSGEAEVQLDGRRLHIPPGCVGLLHPGHTETFYFSRNHRTHHTWCAIHPALLPESLRERALTWPAVQPQSPTFDYLMKAAFAMSRWRSEAARQVLETMSLCLLEEYGRMARAGAEELEGESPWMRARQRIETRFGEADCLEQAARAAGVTPQHLNRLFRKHFNTTPGEWMWQTRVDHGASLLAETGLPIAEVAERCGFKNPFHFSRLVKKYQGQSPRDLRRKAWGMK